jgi:hypothetical protein
MFFAKKFSIFRLSDSVVSEDAWTETLLGLLKYLNIGCAISHPETARLFNREKRAN